MGNVSKCLGMGIFSDGGIFVTKPYLCGSNYFLKMMDLKRANGAILLMDYIGDSSRKIKNISVAILGYQ